MAKMRRSLDRRDSAATARADDALSYGEAKRTPGCLCRPSNTLYWELSPAIIDDCPIHGGA